MLTTASTLTSYSLQLSLSGDAKRYLLREIWMTKKDTTSLIRFDDREKILDIASFVTSAVPWIGGPVSNVLGGISTGRKIQRVHDLLLDFSEDLKDFKSEVSEEYVKTEDFEDLLEQTLRRTSEERNEEKRKALKSFLVEAVKNPGEQYDDQLRFLKIMEDIYTDHIRVIKACMVAPDQSRGGLSGSPSQTLRKRIPDMSDDRITDLVQQLNDLRITNLQGLKTMMTASGAQDLRSSLTPLGKKFVRYLDND